MIINYPTGGVFYNIENPMGRREVIPHCGGLYLVGNTIFNPMTNEQFFMVKIGMSINIYDRMKTYATSNPMMFHIGYKIVDCDSLDLSSYPSYKRKAIQSRYIKELEEQYHKAMEARKFCHFEYAQEWFIVDQKTYLEICEKKFDFFNI
jgi:hypothetical protein